MKISSINLKNFKRFTELSIKQIPENAKLVLLIGSNGSGKSSLFDAFDFLQKGTSKTLPFAKNEDSLNYYRKENNDSALIDIYSSNGERISKQDWDILSGRDLSTQFIGRSSIRNVSRISTPPDPQAIMSDEDSPRTFVDNDERFLNDVYNYISSINKAMREPIFRGEQADTLKIFHEFIEPFNNSLRNIFGNNPKTNISIAEFEDFTPQNQAKLIFKKGDSKINYDFLSHGEKQIVILLLNFIVRQDNYKDKIIFIDEMDVHLNTKLQYNAIKEITERWIPENSQLWTASHALGFIDYAMDYQNGVVLDFDDLDFDLPQEIIPASKSSYQVYELAVSKEFLDKVFQDKTIYFSEQSDTVLYNDLNIENTFFFDGKDKIGAFNKAKGLNVNALVDRDYLSDEEVSELKKAYTFLKFTPYYNLESLLFHPENLAKYFSKMNIQFDKSAYVNDIFEEKEKHKIHIASGIAKARDGYPFYKENEHSKKLIKFKSNIENILKMLESNEFETFYKVFNAKDYGRNIPARLNLNKAKLAKTTWFKEQILNVLK